MTIPPRKCQSESKVGVVVDFQRQGYYSSRIRSGMRDKMKGARQPSHVKKGQSVG